MIKLYICCLVLIIGSVEVGPDIDMKFHQEVMEIVSYDSTTIYFVVKHQITYSSPNDDVQVVISFDVSNTAWVILFNVRSKASQSVLKLMTLT